MVESNAKIMKIVLSLLAIVSVVLLIVFVAGGGEQKAADEEDYDYVEDGEDMMSDFSEDELDYEFSDFEQTSETDIPVSSGDTETGIEN